VRSRGESHATSPMIIKKGTAIRPMMESALMPRNVMSYKSTIATRSRLSRSSERGMHGRTGQPGLEGVPTDYDSERNKLATA